MMTSHIRDVFRHMEWADSRVWSAVLTAESTRVDDQVWKTLHHIHETQHAFLNVWLELPFRRWNLDDFKTPGEIAAWGMSFHESAIPFLAALEESVLDKATILPWAKYFARTLGKEPEPTTLADTLHQLTSHSMHHRGQVARRIRELGEAPPMLDYIGWVWAGRSAPSWP
ncbi:MAG: damage-inducible protein DinB [Rhodothermales bacterium]|nr:damage-inducible protein DinB [Rhodothermales bacterium]